MNNHKLIIELEKRRLNLSHYSILEDVVKGTALGEDIKETSSYATLERKDLVAEGMLTVKGDSLYKELTGSEPKKKVKKKAEPLLDCSQQFDEWWAAFPSTDRVMLKDTVIFLETRGLRTGKKDKVKERYIEILNEGVYSHKELLDALNYEVEMRIAQSLDKGENKLTFMKGSLTYLNQASYESFIELAKIKRTPNSKSDTVII